MHNIIFSLAEVASFLQYIDYQIRTTGLSRYRMKVYLHNNDSIEYNFDLPALIDGGRVKAIHIYKDNYKLYYVLTPFDILFHRLFIYLL